jgi:HlyD family secretion protein
MTAAPTRRFPSARTPAGTLVAGIALAAIVVAAISGCQAQHKAPLATPAAAQTPYAAVAEGKADVEGGIIQVASRTAGVVREVTVLEGDQVVRGQVLARQEDDAPRLALRTAEASLAQAQAQLGVTQVQLAAALREKARLASLEGVVSRQQADQAADAIDSAHAALATERAAIAVARTQLDEARYRLEQTVVRAPANGVIVRRYANPGTGASTLNVTPMFDLEPTGARIVRAEVTETELPVVGLGQAVRILPEADQSRAWPGKVLRRAALFGARKLQSDDPAERTDERVVEVVVSADGAPFLVGQRVLVKFVKPGANPG